MGLFDSIKAKLLGEKEETEEEKKKRKERELNLNPLYSLANRKNRLDEEIEKAQR